MLEITNTRTRVKTIMFCTTVNLIEGISDGDGICNIKGSDHDVAGDGLQRG